MNDEQINLARRAVACKGWRWMPGMAGVLSDMRHLRVANDHAPYWGGAGLRLGNEVSQDALPDLTDPATMGCLLALVREAWKAPSTVVVPLSGNRWGVAIPNVLRESPRHKGDTEAEALVAALEAAP